MKLSKRKIREAGAGFRGAGITKIGIATFSLKEMKKEVTDLETVRDSHF
jgi:hypothetical protein